jgi:hypothetical protein
LESIFLLRVDGSGIDSRRTLLFIAKVMAIFHFGHAGRACCLRGAWRESSQRHNRANDVVNSHAEKFHRKIAIKWQRIRDQIPCEVGLRKRAFFLVATFAGIALERFDALTRDNRNYENCGYSRFHTSIRCRRIRSARKRACGN